MSGFDGGDGGIQPFLNFGRFLLFSSVRLLVGVSKCQYVSVNVST